jgi:RHS repeat-associated protein
MRLLSKFASRVSKSITRHRLRSGNPLAKRLSRRMFLEPLERRELLTIYADFYIGTAEDTIEGPYPMTNGAQVGIGRYPKAPTDLNHEFTDTLTITYTAQGTGADPAGVDDYYELEGTVILEPYEPYDIIYIQAFDDCRLENTESLLITVTNVVSDDPDVQYDINSTTAVVTIEDNDFDPENGGPSPPCPSVQPVQEGCEDCQTGGAQGPVNAWANPAAIAGAANSGGSPGKTAFPVRYFDGAVALSSTDLESDAGGVSWGVTRTWTNVPNYAPNNSVGSGMVVTERPTLVQQGEGSDVAVIVDGTTAYHFDWDAVGSSYVPLGFRQEKLEYNATTDEFTLTDLTGARFTFYDFASSLPWHQKGQLKSYTDPSGNVTTLDYSTNGRLLEVERSSTVGSTTVNESFLYAYIASGENKNLVENITLRRNVNGGSWTTVRKVLYDYYDSTETHGNVGDLETATITDGTNIIDTTYYRYYTPLDNFTGYEHGLKYVFKPASYARLVAAEGSTLDSILDEDAAPFADHYFEYDGQQRVTKETAQGAGCSACTGGQGSFTLSYSESFNTPDYNAWSVKTVETLPDGNENIVYTNYLGQVMLEVFRDNSDPENIQDWATYYQFDNGGRVIFRAEPSAISGYDENYPALVDDDGGNLEYVRDSAGLVATFTYYASTTATSSTPGGAKGYLDSIAIRQGESGTSVPQSQQTYLSRTVGTTTTFVPAVSTIYSNTNGTGGLDTTNAYTFVSGTVQVESIATTDASGGVTTDYFDSYGRPIWAKDAAGFLHYTAYDQTTGAVVKTIADVDTTQTADFANKPSTWTTPTGGGIHAVKTYEVDSLGRPTKTTDPNGNVTYTVYDDIDREVRIYPGWNTSTNTTTGPTIVVRDDRANNYTEVLTMSATPSVTSGKPNGSEAIASLQSLSRTHYNSAGQAIHTDDYFNLAGLTYSTSASLGTLNTHFYRTTSAYDSRGRQHRTVGGDGTIYRTVFDGLGRPVSEWAGDNDTPVSGDWSPDNPADMVNVQSYTYDDGGIGDSLLTAVSDALSRVTTLGYDFRGRSTSTTLPDPDGGGSLTAPVYATTYDNLSRVLTETDPLSQVTTYAYNVPARTTTTTLPDPDGGGALGSPVTVHTYDARGLLVSLLDPVGNTTTWAYNGLGLAKSETNELSDTRTFSYDDAGNLTERIDRLGREIEYVYDKANRQTHEKWYDGITLVRTMTYTYDAAGHLDQATDIAATYGYDYDALGRTTYESQSFANFSPLLEYERAFDGADQLTSLAAIIAGTADFQNAYTYDHLNRLSLVTQQDASGGNVVADKRADFAYNDAGQFTKISRYADLAGAEHVASSHYSYDDIGRLLKLVHSTSTTPPGSGWGSNALAGYQFTYDASSRVGSIDSYVDGLTSFTHDNTDQLKTADHTGQTDESYSYDENGNRTMSGHSIGDNNRLLSDGTYNYTYDDEGNRLTKTKISTGEKEEYTWDHRNRLTKITFKNSGGTVLKTVDQMYDVYNQWIKRSVDADGPGSGAAVDTFFSHEAGQVALQFAGGAASNLSHRYLWGPAVDQLLADESVTSLASAGSVQYPLGDHLGTLRDLATYNAGTNTTMIDNHRRYDSYGNLTSETNAAIDQLFGFTGRAFDESTGLQNNLNRWYHSQSGQWISEDPLGFEAGDANLRRYVSNRVTSGTDPTGLFTVGAGIGASGQLVCLHAAVSVDITVGVNTNPSSIWDILSIGISATGGRTITGLGLGAGVGVQGTVTDASSASSLDGDGSVAGGYGGPFTVEFGNGNNGVMSGCVAAGKGVGLGVYLEERTTVMGSIGSKAAP